MSALREIRGQKWLTDGYTHERSLTKLLLDKPDVSNASLTYLWGKDGDKFPLSALTEGQDGGVKECNNIQYTWPVMGKTNNVDTVAYFDSSNNSRGAGGSPFHVYFSTNKFIEQHGVMAPDRTMYRIMDKPKKSGSYWRYTLEPKNPSVQCATSNLVSGISWVLTAPTVPESFSRGNRSNVRGTGKMTNQISILRYTKHIGGNLANKIVEIQFETEGGGTTNRWINEEMRQFEVDIKQKNEEHFWSAHYNRGANGEILMKDYDSGEPIPEGAGIMEIVKEANYDTYGLNLTLHKIKSTVTDVFSSDSDSTKMDIVLYCGTGFGEDFDAAIRTDVATSGFERTLGDKSITGEGDGLKYGAYFRQYTTIQGHKITVKTMNLLDHGFAAEMDKANGNIHPRSGRPMSSHTGFFLDQSTYSSERNIRMYVQKGNKELRGIYQGMNAIPESWGASFNGNTMEKKLVQLATDEGKSSYEVMYTRGVNIDNSTHCFMLQSVK